MEKMQWSAPQVMEVEIEETEGKLGSCPDAFAQANNEGKCGELCS